MKKTFDCYSDIYTCECLIQILVCMKDWWRFILSRPSDVEALGFLEYKNMITSYIVNGFFRVVLLSLSKQRLCITWKGQTSNFSIIVTNCSS